MVSNRYVFTAYSLDLRAERSTEDPYAGNGAGVQLRPHAQPVDPHDDSLAVELGGAGGGGGAGQLGQRGHASRDVIRETQRRVSVAIDERVVGARKTSCKL